MIFHLHRIFIKLLASQSAQVLQCSLHLFGYSIVILVILNVKELSKSILEKIERIYSAQKIVLPFTKYCMSEKNVTVT
jgi:hypothetical protein